MDLWERAYKRGVLSELYRSHPDVWRLLKCVKLNRCEQYYSKPWVVRLLIDAIHILKSVITQAWNHMHIRLLRRLSHGAMVKKNRFIPQPDDLERYTHGEDVSFLSKEYLVSAGLPRRGYVLYSLLKHGALPGSLLGQLNVHLYS